MQACTVFLMRNIKPEKDVMGFCFQTSFQLCHLEVKEMWEDEKTRHWVIKTSGQSQTALITQVSVLQGGASQDALQSMGMLRVYSSELLCLLSFLLLEWAQQIASW